MTAAEIFLSFSRSDLKIAEKVRSRLVAEGLSVYDYTQSVQSGEWFTIQLRALVSCQVAIFLVTPASSKSKACMDEALRVADPSQMMTCVPIPIVIGDWDFPASDLWLVLSKFNWIEARDGVTKHDLNRLVEMARGCLARNSASLSTGQSLEAVKIDLCRYLSSVEVYDSEKLRQEAQRLQSKHRGRMVSFLQFAHLDRELRAADLIENPRLRCTYLVKYLDSFFARVVERALADTAARLASCLRANDTIVISEYSRVILRGLQVLSGSNPEVFRSLRFFIVSRTGMLLVDAEPRNMADGIRELGGRPKIISFADWISYVRDGEDSSRLGKVDKLLFGVEAFSTQGDVVYPQIVNEFDALRTRRSLGGRLAETEVIAAGESYKVCRDGRELSRMIADPHHTIISATVFDRIVTDVRIVDGRSTTPNLTDLVDHVEVLTDGLRRKHWPKGTPLPVWNVPASLRVGLRVLASDIDGTLTSGTTIGSQTLSRISTLAQIGVMVVLVTGRSAGWGAALAHYIPGLTAVIAENGAVAIDPRASDGAPILLDQFDEETRSHRLRNLDICVRELQQANPHVTLSADNFSRVTDRTILIDDDVSSSLVARFAEQYGLRYTYSSVHHHLSVSELDKATGLSLAMRLLFGIEEAELRESSITVGDSFNDGPLFDSTRFAATVGVRGVLPHLQHLGHQRPSFVTLAEEGAGFLELTELIVADNVPTSLPKATFA